MKYSLYHNYETSDYYMIRSDEVCKYLSCTDNDTAIYYQGPKEVLENYEKYLDTPDCKWGVNPNDANNWAAENNLPENFHYLDDYEIVRDLFVIDQNTEEISNLLDWADENRMLGYCYWDGNNFAMLWLDEADLIIEFNDDDCLIYKLDEWDGDNVCTGGRGRHEKIVVTPDDKYISWSYNDWIGSIDSGYLFESRKALKKYLATVNRAEHLAKMVVK